MNLLLGVGEHLGDYRIEALLGRGGMGVVYLASKPPLDRRVALKVLPGGFASERAIWRLRREARVLGRLAHPGLVRVYDAGCAGATPFYAMEWVDGDTLRARLDGLPRERDERHPEVQTLVRALVQVASALACAHAAGVVHRDVKPGNILLSRDGRALLGDFGLAIDSEAHELTATGEVVGTPYYMAPEQVAGATVDHRADVYALGVVLYETLAHTRPFEGATTGAVLDAIARSAPVPLPQACPTVSRDLAAVVAKAMARDVADRYADAGALAADLGAALAGEPVSARPPGALRRLRGWARREPWRVVALATALAAGAGLAALWHGFHQTVRAEGERVATTLDEMHRLALGVQLERAEAAARAFAPARPQDIERMQSWLQTEAEPLERQLPQLGAFVAELRQRALPYGAAEAELDRATHPQAEHLARVVRTLAYLEEQLAAAEQSGPRLSQVRVNLAMTEVTRRELREAVAQRRTWRFARPAEQLLHDRAASLLAQLEQFVAAETGTIARVREQLDWAQISRQRCLVDAAPAWGEIRAQIAADPLYGGLRLAPQTDLLPLGRDPDSGLFEFVHLRSGEPDREVPERDARGAVLPAPDMGIVLVLLPGGEATLGAQAEAPELPHFDPQARAEEQPVHRVRLAPFFIGKFELTQDQWARLTDGDWPSKRYGNEHLRVKHRPVNNVALAVARATLAQVGLGLPTAAQWEYACRAGTTTPHYFAADAAPRFANLADRSAQTLQAPWPLEAWDDGHPILAPVGSYAANAFGLHDVHGNVREWCDDPTTPYDRPADATGRRPLTTTDRPTWQARGGAFESKLQSARSAARTRDPAGAASHAIGMRAARAVEPADDRR